MKKKVYVVWHFYDGNGHLLKIFRHRDDAEQFIENLKNEDPDYWYDEELIIREEKLA